LTAELPHFNSSQSIIFGTAFLRGLAVPETPEKHPCASQVALAWCQAAERGPWAAFAAGSIAFCLHPIIT